MSELKWGDIPYDHRTPEQIIDDFVLVRGDLSEQYARDQLARQWRRHMAAARAEALREAADFCEAVIANSMGVLRSDYADGWREASSQILAELRDRAQEPA